MINETLARLGWPGEDPIGRSIKPGDRDSNAPWMTVVGVIGDVRRLDVMRAIRPELYMCGLQVTPRTQMVLVLTAADAAAILPSSGTRCGS